MVRIIKQPKAKNIKEIIFYYYWQILLLCFCLVFVLEYFIVVSPLIKLTKNNRELDMKFYENLLSEEEKFLSNLETIVNEAESLNERDLSKLDDVMATKVNVPELLNEFYLIAQDSGYDLNNISFSSEQGINKINVSFSGGDYQSFKKLLSIIENNIHIMDITNLAFSGAGENCSFTLLTYYLE